MVNPQPGQHAPSPVAHPTVRMRTRHRTRGTHSTICMGGSTNPGLGASLGSRGLPDVSAEGRSPLQGVLYTSCSTCSQHPIDESTYCEQHRVPTQANHMRRGGNHCTEDVISIGFVVTPLPLC